MREHSISKSPFQASWKAFWVLTAIAFQKWGWEVGFDFLSNCSSTSSSKEKFAVLNFKSSWGWVSGGEALKGPLLQLTVRVWVLYRVEQWFKASTLE